MHTLKFQLGITLSVLLFGSMFLFGFVILMLWQRDIILQETELSEEFLHIAAISLASDTPYFPRRIAERFQKNGVLCIQWQETPAAPLRSHGSCPAGNTLASQLHEAASTGKQTSAYSGMSWNGFFLTKQYLLTAIPLHATSQENGSIALVKSLEQSSLSIHKARKIFFAYLIINILIFTTLGFTRLIHLIIKPIQRLSSLADSHADLNDKSVFHSEGLGEFTQLSLSLNRLVSKIDGDKQELRSTVNSLQQANDELQRNRDEMIQAEKLASIGRLSAGLAHEIGNPLGIIQGYIDLLSDPSLNTKDREAFSTRATRELNRINSLIKSLLDLSRTPVDSIVKEIDLHAVITDLFSSIHVRKTRYPISYTTTLDAEDSIVAINMDSIRQVLLNCLLNSIDAIEESTSITQGRIVLTTTNEDEKFIKIIITDNGTGIDPAHINTIFDPFFTTKEVGKGTGLGLAVAHNLIKKSDGCIEFSSNINQGTLVTITLPLTVAVNIPLQQGRKS